MLFDREAPLATLVLGTTFVPHINVANHGVHGGQEYEMFVIHEVKKYG